MDMYTIYVINGGAYVLHSYSSFPFLLPFAYILPTEFDRIVSCVDKAVMK